MKKFVFRLLIILGLPAFMLAGAAPAYARSVILYQSPQVAQSYCPADVVVWLDMRDHVFFYPGSPYFGMTLDGGFTCRGLAILGGNLPAR
jgi:hypothetical protein